MQGKLAFGRRKHEELPSKLKKLAKREEGAKTCRAGACPYAAVLEATQFRAEATRKGKAKQKGAGAWASSDCDSSLYDSFELDSFSSKLGHCLAAERLHVDAAHQKSDMAQYSWRQRSHVAPRWHSRRHSISCCPFTFPSCFPKRTPTIQLGKRKKPSLHHALHVIAKVARRGCHVIAALPACTTHGNVQQPQRIPQTQLHYHHHIHQYNVQRPAIEARNCEDGDPDDREEHDRMANEACDCDCDRSDRDRDWEHIDSRGHERSLGKAAPQLLLPTPFLSPHTLAYLPLQEMDHHLTSIKYHS